MEIHNITHKGSTVKGFPLCGEMHTTCSAITVNWDYSISDLTRKP